MDSSGIFLAEAVMRLPGPLLSLILAGTTVLPAQAAQQTLQPAAPQTARQALLEMFVGKAPDGFEKHLPAAAHHALVGKGTPSPFSIVAQIAGAGRRLASGEHFETYDEGSLLLVSEPSPREKIEVVVDQDSLMGEE